ncbi:MAG: Asp/Glu/hydantoin racemase [Tissierellia bacterium]|nr:Asp/Glu/hydantoin racemase [Tissierellia bacterium]
MKILLINPNSDELVTNSMKLLAASYIEEGISIDCIDIPDAPKFIGSYYDHFLISKGLVNIIKENNDRYDGFIIGCHGDPNLELLKEITVKPLVGIGEVSMKVATLLGDSFSVIMASSDLIPNKKVMINNYGLDRYFNSVRVANVENEKKINEELVEACENAVYLDKSEVLVLGCAAFSGKKSIIERTLNVPVVDGVSISIGVLIGIIKAKLSISKVGRYKLKN